MKLLSRVRLFATPWTVTHQVPLSMGFSRQENWRGLSFPSPGGLPDPGIEPEFPVSPALACGLFTSREVQPHDYAALISMHCRQILYCLSHQGSPRSCLKPDPTEKVNLLKEPPLCSLQVALYIGQDLEFIFTEIKK